MRTFSVTFFLGTCLLLVLSALPSNSVFYGNYAAGGCLWLTCWIFRGKYRALAVLSRVLLGLLLGSFLALHTAKSLRDAWIAPSQEGEDILITGVIVDIPEYKSDGWHFLVAANSEVVQGNVLLGWYDKKAPALQAGQQWQLVVRLKRPNGFSNPNGFDYEQWLFAQRIVGVGSVRESSNNQLLAQPQWFNPQVWRQYFQDRLTQALANQPTLGLVQGLAIANTDHISQQQWSVLRQTGTIHLLAISGLHITMVAAIGVLPVLGLWRCVPRLALWLPARIAGGIFGGLLATGYSLLAGMNIPTQRTLLMLLILLLGLIARRHLAFSVTFSAALLAVVLWDPLACLSVGFWLSFMTVGLLVILGNRQRQVGKSAVVWMQLALSLGTIPLAVGFFGMVSLVAPLANLLAIPIITFLVTPLILLGLVLSFWQDVAVLLWHIAAGLLDYLMLALQWLNDWPYAITYIALVPWYWLVCAGLGFLWLCLPSGMPGRWLGLIACLPLWLYQPPRPVDGAFRLAVLDVGQGLASAVQTASHILVFDTGAKTSPTFDSGELVVLPWLRGQGVQQVDRLMISHDDNDHSGGAQAVLNGMTVKSLWVGSRALFPERQPVLCTAGQHWTWDGVDFQVLHPSEDFTDSKDNNRSCVLRVNNAWHSVLLTADIERAAENWLVERAEKGETLVSDVLVVPHHGSKTSSSSVFLDAVKPQLAVITSGYRNRYHHPHADVIKRYTEQQIPVVNTVDAGALSLDFPNSTAAVSVARWRNVKPHIWQR